MDDIAGTLTSLLGSVPGATMAALLGGDGIGVEVVLGADWPDTEPAVLEVELAALAEAVQRAAARMGRGPGTLFFLGTARADFLGRPLDSGYFLVLGLAPGADLSRAREALGRAGQALA